MLILLFLDASASTDGTAGHRCLRVGCSHGFTSQLQLIRDENILEILLRKSRKGRCTFCLRNQVVFTIKKSTITLIVLGLTHCLPRQLLKSFWTGLCAAPLIFVECEALTEVDVKGKD